MREAIQKLHNERRFPFVLNSSIVCLQAAFEKQRKFRQLLVTLEEEESRGESTLEMVAIIVMLRDCKPRSGRLTGENCLYRKKQCLHLGFFCMFMESK